MRKLLGMTAAGTLLSALAGVFLGLTGYTFKYAEGASYLSNNPQACVNCHIMREQFDSWQKSVHHAVAACNDCHVPQDVVGKYLTKAEHGYRHSKAFTFQDFHEPIRITPADLEIVEANCVRCHGELVSPLTEHAAASGETMDCARCHARVGHGSAR